MQFRGCFWEEGSHFLRRFEASFSKRAELGCPASIDGAGGDGDSRVWLLCSTVWGMEHPTAQVGQDLCGPLAGVQGYLSRKSQTISTLDVLVSSPSRNGACRVVLCL